MSYKLKITMDTSLIKDEDKQFFIKRDRSNSNLSKCVLENSSSSTICSSFCDASSFQMKPVKSSYSSNQVTMTKNVFFPKPVQSNFSESEKQIDSIITDCIVSGLGFEEAYSRVYSNLSQEDKDVNDKNEERFNN